MKKQLVHISTQQTAKVLAAIYFVISLPIAVLMAVSMMFQGQLGISLVTLVVMPIMYAVFGFLFTLFGAWAYNLIAAKVGGIEFTTTEV